MGAGIAASHLRAGFGTTLVDVQPEALARSVTGILDEAAWDRNTKRTDPARALALAGNLRTATQGFTHDMVGVPNRQTLRQMACRLDRRAEFGRRDLAVKQGRNEFAAFGVHISHLAAPCVASPTFARLVLQHRTDPG
jgi:hypothetical protein